MLSENTEEELIHDLVTAVQCGDMDSLHAVYSPHSNPADNMSVYVIDSEGCSLLQWAAVNNQLEVAKFLLNLDPKRQLLAMDGGILRETPLQWAIRKKHYAMVNLLSSYGASLDHKNIHGQDALHIACRQGKH